MRRIILLISIGCFIFSILQSQVIKKTDIRMLFKGIVLDAGSLSPVINSQITINRNFSSVSGTDGTFSFFVNKYDTVVFNSLGYKPATLFISDTLSGMEFIAGVYLQSDTLSIGEVIIVPKFSGIKSEIFNSESKAPATMDNAKYNVAVSAYAGRNSVSSLGDPASNYELLRQQQKTNAYEKGGIPSDKMLGLSPFMLIPATYLLMHGLPEKPASYKQEITSKELEALNKRYLELIRMKHKDKR